MTAIRVMPSSGILHVEDAKQSPRAPGATKQGGDRGRTVHSKQSSIEVAYTERNSLGAEKEERFHDVCVEAEEMIESAASPACSTERREDVAATTVSDDSGRSIEFSRAQEEEHQENARETTACEEKLRANRPERGRKSADRKEHCGDRDAAEGEKRGGGGSWWKDGGQTILQFFAKILGKRGGMGAKGAPDRVSPSGNKRRGRRVVRVSRGDGNRNARGRAGARLKRVSNGYIATHVYRYSQGGSGRVYRRRNSVEREFVAKDGCSRPNESQCRSAVENKSRKRWQREEPRPSILTRQIQRTRDKNLRVALLEQELRSRFPVKNVASVDQVLRLRQLSSPLC